MEEKIRPTPTPTPWRIKTSGNMGNTIEAESGKRHGELDDGYRVVAVFQECCASNNYLEQRANCAANGAFIVKAVNVHEGLVAALRGMLRVCPSERNGMTLPEYQAARAALAKLGE